MALSTGSVPRTIVAFDESAPSSAALEWAVARERLRHGTVQVVHVVDDIAIDADQDEIERLVFDARRGAEAAVDRVRREVPEVSLLVDLRRGDPEVELRGLSVPETLVVVGTHQRAGRERRFGWSLGARLAATAKGPVAIIPELPMAAGRTGVVVGVNGSAGSIQAARFAAREALLRDEPLEVVLAWEDPGLGSGVRGLNPEFTQWLVESNREVLNEALALLGQEFPGLQINSHLDNESATPTLLAYGKKASLLVVGTRGHGALRRFLLGSVSHGLVLGITGPMIVVGPEGAV
jgi:nucleotide-binding universal stress UspA family protein